MYNIDLDIAHTYLVGGLWPTNKKKDGWYGFRCNARCEKTALDIWYMLEIDYHSFPNPITNLFPSMFWCFPRRPLQSRRWIKQLKSLKSGEYELFDVVCICFHSEFVFLKESSIPSVHPMGGFSKAFWIFNSRFQRNLRWGSQLTNIFFRWVQHG